MASWRWIAADLRTNTLLGEVPLTDVTFGEVLNGAGSFSATLPVAGASTVAARLIAASSEPGRTVIWFVRNEVVLGGAIVWDRTRAKNQPAKLAGAGFWSFFRMQHARTTQAFAAVDQLSLARSLVQTAQAIGGANIGVTVGTETSGIARDRTYWSYELKQVGEAVEQLANVDGGFDFAIDVTQQLGKVLTLSYPRRGRIAGSTGIAFVDGKNLLDYEVVEDASRCATVFTAVGAGEGGDMLIATKTRTDRLDIGFPLLSATGSWKDVSRQSTLDGYAQAGVDARATVPMFWTLDVDPDDIDGGFGTFIVGDDALLEIGSDDHFPRQTDGQPGYRRFHRIIAWSASVPAAGRESLSVTLGIAS
jgi:hypothetical protein